MDELQNRLAQALVGAIGDQARIYLAKVTNVAGKANGQIQAFSEVHGTINVICKTTDRIRIGDRIHVRKSSPDKYAPFIYAGFGGGVDGTKLPGTGGPVYVEPPDDSGAGLSPVDSKIAAAAAIRKRGWVDGEPSEPLVGLRRELVRSR
jgi:hypothetical protein